MRAICLIDPAGYRSRTHSMTPFSAFGERETKARREDANGRSEGQAPHFRQTAR